MIMCGNDDDKKNGIEKIFTSSPILLLVWLRFPRRHERQIHTYHVVYYVKDFRLLASLTQTVKCNFLNVLCMQNVSSNFAADTNARSDDTLLHKTSDH